MAYFIDLFSPETYQAFTASDQKVSGFRERHKGIAASVKPGDKLIGYMTKLSRWVGILEVTGHYFLDSKPIFVQPSDPFIVRLPVVPAIWLRPEQSIPISENICWKELSFTKELPKGSLGWTGMVRGSLRRLSDEDGAYLESILLAQSQSPRTYKLSDSDQKKLRSSVVNRTDSQVFVSIPDDDKTAAGGSRQVKREQHESTKMQALLAQIGEQMHMQIWLPRNDRQRVLELWTPEAKESLLERLPLNYDDVTLGTIENIDVIWIRKRSIIRAFEVEHTTSIYSGILRMADLMALQPDVYKRQVHSARYWLFPVPVK